LAFIAEVSKEESLESTWHLINTILVILAIAAVAVVVAQVVVRMVINPLGAELDIMQSVAERISKGNLTYKFDESINEKSVYGAMRTMSSNLYNMIDEIRECVQRQTSIAGELAGISDKTSINVQSQHTNTTQIATAMHKMTSSVEEIAHMQKKLHTLPLCQDSCRL